MLVSPGKLNAHAKRTLVERVVFERLAVAEAARMANISRQTAHRWIGRYRRYGWDGLNPQSRRPHTCPGALPEAVVEAILTIRVQSGRGPQWIGWRFDLPPSTVHRVLRRWNLHRLKWLDRVARTPVRYERAAPGELLHLDVKKLQRIPPGGGRRFDPSWRHDRSRSGHGYDLLHVAIDDYSRYLYVEALPDAKGPTTVAFLERALSHFASLGVGVQRILTDNGMNYRSNLFRRIAQERGIALKRTRPYRPQTNGKADASSRPCFANGPTSATTTAMTIGLQPSESSPWSTIPGDHTWPSDAVRPFRGSMCKPCRGTRHVGAQLWA